MTDSCVRVVVRIRPQVPSELLDMCHVCTSVTPREPQIWLGKDKAFTFDHVFNMTAAQENVYLACIQDLIDGCFKGYNATILAYGQTGSGKTYTMGTGFDVSIGESELGIIPRAVNQLFETITKMQNEAIAAKLPQPEFQIVAQFMELYNEDIIDLLDPLRDDDKGKKSNVKIHEDSNGEIVILGITSHSVSSASEVLQCLKMGALSRTTASTKMNAQSSRSHAVFTLRITQQRLMQFEPSEENGEMGCVEELASLTSKLHFVDLAGSERLKRTGATGDRAREGISINCGLLALGNVISALGDKTKRSTHVPYRDSKLTRLLQDSLGGNSQTLMIACISPSDRDFMESLNTLKYANRAKNIHNKISVNQDKSTQTISNLRKEIQQLQLELMEYKQGKRMIGNDGEERVNDMYHENMFLESENSNLRSRLKALQETLDRQTQRLTDLLAEKAAGAWITIGENEDQPDFTEVIKGYMKEIEDLRVKLLEAEEMISQLRKQAQRNQTVRSALNSPMLNCGYQPQSDATRSEYEILQEAKQEVKVLTKRLKTLEKEKIVEQDGQEEQAENNDEEKEKDDLSKDKAMENEVNGVDDEDEDLEGESSDDSDGDDKDGAETCDLVQLTQDISVKQSLIQALEESQQRLRLMRHHYEDKLSQLENKIRETETERDRMLAGLGGNKENKSGDKVKKVKEDFEKKLGSLQSELKKMQVLKKEHVKAMRNQALSERQIERLKTEVAEMKRTKVKLITKMKEDSQRHQQAEQKRNSEIAQLKKQSRIKENKIRTLETDKKLKENVLKRKQEEIVALRKTAKPMSDRVAGRVAQLKENDFLHRRKFASPKASKTRWQSLEKSINQHVISRQSVDNIEKSMKRFLKEREQLNKKLEDLKQKRNAAVLGKKSPEVIQDYDDNIETLKATLDYCQENISECQTNIIQMGEAKEEIDLLDIEKFTSTLGIHESRYLVGKLINMAISQTFQVYQKEGAIQELDQKLKQSSNSNNVYLSFLERLAADGKTDVLNYFTSNDDDFCSASQCSSRSNSPIDSSFSEVSAAYEVPKSKKPPRKTGLPSQFMTICAQASNLVASDSCPTVNDSPVTIDTSRMTCSVGPELEQDLDLDTTFIVPNNDVAEQRGIVRVTSAPTSLQDMLYGRKAERSPMQKRRSAEKHMADFSPAFSRKFNSNTSVIPPACTNLSRQSSVETTASDISPPNSPSGSRKIRDSNVFSRLTSGSFRFNKPGCGVVLPLQSKINAPKKCPIICTHMAQGHSRAVLSIHATDDVLFSGSKDRTVKIWDLVTGKEIQSISHSNQVRVVKYSEYSGLAFSVSSAYIKVWDVRENPANCWHTLSSHGLSTAGNFNVTAPPRTASSKKEPDINDIALNRYGSTLFSAAGNELRIWDLRSYRSVAKISRMHQSAIMCLAVENDGSDKNIVVTGSKDHYIKVCEFTDGTDALQMTKTNLKPPHYDGIQSLAMTGKYLFSASRDRCIKKWDFKRGTHIQSIIAAHRDWIMALDLISNGSILLSGCRAGYLKLWSKEKTEPLGEIQAHSSAINSISSNGSCTFTASSDCNVGIWRIKDSEDLSPENDFVEA